MKQTIQAPNKQTQIVEHWYEYILAYAEEAAIRGDYRIHVNVEIKESIFPKVEKKLLKMGFKIAKCVNHNKKMVENVILTWD